MASSPRSPAGGGDLVTVPMFNSDADFPILSGSIQKKRSRSGSPMLRSPMLNSNSHDSLNSLKIQDSAIRASDQNLKHSSNPPSDGEISTKKEELNNIDKNLRSNQSQSLEKQIPNLSSQEQKAKLSYSAAVDINSSLPSFQIDTSKIADGSIFQVPSEVEKDDKPLWIDLLVGSFPEKAPHPGVIHVIIKQIWKFGFKDVKFEVHAINKTMVKIRINIKKVREKVLNRGMWRIADLPMVVSSWSPKIEEVQPIITHMPLWIEMKNIPHRLFTRQGLSFLASAVGKPLKLHQNTLLCSKFDEAKIQVEVDLNRELPSEMLVKLSSTGQVYKISFSYPWLPPRCDLCSKWGHVKGNCLKKLIDAGESSAVLIEKVQTKHKEDKGKPELNIQKDQDSPGVEEGEISETPTQKISIEDNYTRDSAQKKSIPKSSDSLEQKTIQVRSQVSDSQQLTKSPLSPKTSVPDTNIWISPTKTARIPLKMAESPIKTGSRYDILKDIDMSDGDFDLSDIEGEGITEHMDSDKSFKTGRNLRSRKARADKKKTKETSDQKQKGRKGNKGRKRPL